MISYGQLVIDRTYNIEVQIPPGSAISAGLTIDFPNNVEQLFTKTIAGVQYDVRVDGIEVITADQLAVSPAQNTVVSSANINNWVLTLDDLHGEPIYQCPGYTLLPANNNGFIRIFNNFFPVINKCKIQLFAPGSIAAGQSFLLNFYYTYVNAKTHKDTGNRMPN